MGQQSTVEHQWLAGATQTGGLALTAEEEEHGNAAEERTRRASESAPEVWPALDPYPQASRASEDELRQVAEKLVTFRDLVSGQRMEPASPGLAVLARAAFERMEEDGTLDESRRYWAERDRRIGVLMEWYGNAVRRTQGADPQDLFTLVNLGVISDPEKTAPPPPQLPEHDALGAVAWTPAFSTSTYQPDDDFDELKSLVSTFLGEFAWVTGTLATSSKASPPEWGDRFQQAVELKRRGELPSVSQGLCRSVAIERSRPRGRTSRPVQDGGDSRSPGRRASGPAQRGSHLPREPGSICRRSGCRIQLRGSPGSPPWGDSVTISLGGLPPQHLRQSQLLHAS